MKVLDSSPYEKVSVGPKCSYMSFTRLLQRLLMKWNVNENSTWKTHHHLQLRLITPPCGSAPPISVKSAFLPGQSSFKALL
ncbi:hypothetical protein CHARACLAT_013238 [Characodon lateralis]|uniref:Uncharacterized protein n=1 Tax=Characodon lateralis TaxID=208331 RepID=A0ABU7E3G3_9TELE|nr:hypothetical protein [Characodon lateralis]